MVTCTSIHLQNRLKPRHVTYEVFGVTSATYHYLEPEAVKYCTNTTNADGLDVTVINGGIITPFLKAKVLLAKELSKNAQHTFIVDELKTWYLLSISQLCDDDCNTIFIKFNVKILKNSKIIITGNRNNHGLWSVYLHFPTSPTPKVPQHPKNVANGVIYLQQTKK